MYADVVVLTYQSPEIDSFTYKIPKNLEKQIKIGQLVEVPFGKRQPLGVVLSIVNRPSTIVKNIKPINNIALSAPILLPYQIELLKWMSAYYIAPMVNCLEAMLPVAALNAKRLITKAPSNHLTIHPSIHPTLILVPSISRIPQKLAQFKSAKNYAIYHNELNPAEKFTTFKRILDGGVDYVFGSRSAIFAPCPNLKKIVIYDDHDGAYKDERSPYFDTLTVAEKIAQLTKAEIEIVDPSPKITTYFLSLNRHSKPHEESHKRDPSSFASLRTQDDTKRLSVLMPKIQNKFKIIDLAKEKLAGNYSSIAIETEDYLKRVVISKKNALLFLNKKKESGHLFCKSCKQNVFLETEVAFCPNCNSADIFFNSQNIYSLSQTVKKIAKSYPVNVIEQKQKTYHLQNSIDIATSFIFYAPVLKKYELVIFTLADSIQVADFQSEEKLYQTITKLKSLLTVNGLLVIQTYNPQSETIISSAKGDYKSFYTAQINDRKLLSYPPFALLIKLTIKGSKKDAAEAKAKQLAESFAPYTLNPIPYTLLGPYKPIYFAKHPTYSIIIKYKLESYSLATRENAIKNLRPILKNLKNVQVVVEADSLN